MTDFVTTIRRATESDSGSVTSLFLSMIEELRPLGHDVPPLIESAEWFWKNVFSQHIEDSPILIASDNGEDIGAIFWIVTSFPWGKYALGYGTYVKPKHRRSGVARELRKSASEFMRKAGISSVVGTVLVKNLPGMDSSIHAGGTITGYTVSIPC